MKVSEAIDRLEVGDTVWAKATVNAINFEGGYIRAENTKTSIYLDGNAEISLEEPQAEKVVVPDWFDQWYKKLIVDCSYHESKALVLINQCGDGHVLENFDGGIFGGTAKNSVIYTGWINSNRELASRAILDGYTVKPKRWVVKNKERIGLESFVNSTINPVWTTEEPLWMTFTDKAKAEAVATLVEGSVEEV